MKNSDTHEALLILDDGIVIRGRSAGKSGTAIGELCFNTGMMGYQEIFSDPSYFGQVIIMNHVHIGNYGESLLNMESDGVKVNGIICRNLDESLFDFFQNQNIVAIDQIDTRALVHHIRSKGTVRCIISSVERNVELLKEQLNAAPYLEEMDLASLVSTKENYCSGNSDSDIKVALLDLGVKHRIVENFVRRGAFVKVFNAHSTFEEMMTFHPNGFVVSNGPGNPAALGYVIDVIKEILDADYPLMGICLGHQLLALANGATTFKMQNGHRGCNHPVKNLITGKSEMTTQNHGYGIDVNRLKGNDKIEITHINLNDQSIEGIKIKAKKAFSVQYHPEASPGTSDSQYLFDDFFALLNSKY